MAYALIPIVLGLVVATVLIRKRRLETDVDEETAEPVMPPDAQGHVEAPPSGTGAGMPVDPKQSVRSDGPAEELDGELRIARIRETEDQALLSRYAETDPDWTVRVEAIGRLSDQSTLARVALNDSQWEVREAAVRRVTDDTVLAKIVRTEQDEHVQSLAVEAITDQHLLADLMIDSDSDSLCHAILDVLNDPKQLERVALSVPEEENPDGPEVGMMAVAELSDPSSLATVARMAPNATVRTDAVMKLEDPSVLAEVAERDADEEVRDLAAELLEAKS